MENSRSKVEAMKPVFQKAGIPLALSLAGFILAKVATRKSRLSTAPSQQSQMEVDVQESDSCEMDEEESFHSLDSECPPIVEDDRACAEAYCHRNALESSSVVDESRELQEEILGLTRRIEDMQDRERQLQERFLYYQDLKDQEIVLMQLLNKMMLEINGVEFLGREISLLEAENLRFENIAAEHLKLLRLLELFRSENGKLHKRVKKLLRKAKEYSRILRKQRLRIQSKETENSRNKKELELKADCIRLMGDEINELKRVTELLQREKNELVYKLREAEESARPKAEGETASTEKYNQLASEVERLEKHEASETKEALHPSWSKGRLRHELMRRNQEQQQTEESNFGGISDNELNGYTVAQGGATTTHRAHSKRRKLIAKFKKWVEGSERTKERLEEEEKHGNKCFPGNSASDGAEEAFLPARHSCSSA